MKELTMEAKLASCFLGQGWCYGGGFNYKHVNIRFYPSSSHRFLPASCKMRRNYSSQNKRQQAKKIHPDRPTSANLPATGDQDSDLKNFSDTSITSLNDAADDIDDKVESEAMENFSNSSIISLKDTADVIDSTVEALQMEKFVNNSMTSSKDTLECIDSMIEAEQSNEKISLTLLNNKIRSPSIAADGEDQLSSLHLEDLIGMIRNAERNVHLLNQARISAVENLGKILDEKEALQTEINVLEAKLAETDARLRVAAQGKIHVELLEDQLEKLRTELSNSGDSERIMHDELVSVPFSLTEELDILTRENLSLKNDLQVLKADLSSIKGTDERVQMLEKERSGLESSLRELDAKLAASQEDVSKLSTLKSECKSLYEKVEDLQTLLDKATKQADQAIFVLQENQELRKKVDRLEESLEETNVYKLSSERLQHYNDLMQQKIKILDERLQKSDEEIHGYVQLYQDSVKEFQDTLNNLKEESKRRATDDPMDDMPWEFWSHLLLRIDAWSLEKKIAIDDARLLREMAWKRDGRIFNAYMSCKEKKEHEIISTFLRLLSSPKWYKSFGGLGIQA